MLVGTPTNLPVMQRVMHTSAFARAHYNTDFFTKPLQGRIQYGSCGIWR
ncbi:MAG: hypothetical protein H6657_26485 [Ardenticatenaceae bacterium]|nr:hypothetical protein [Ardenticatenaceae bacterium]